LAVQGTSDTVAIGLVLNNNGEDVILVKFDLSTTGYGAFSYSGLQPTYAMGSFSLNAARGVGGYMYFTGGITNYLGKYLSSSWSNIMGYVSRMSLTENVPYSTETCN
jgi:hypothetical protein